MASDSGAQGGSSGQDIFRRLVSSLSGRDGPTSPSAAPSTSIEEPAMSQSPSTIPSSPSVSTPGEPLQRVASASSSIKKARMKIGERLKQLGKDIGKLRKGNNKSVPASPRITLGELSPTTESSAAQISGHAKLLSMVAELDEPEGASTPTNPDDAPSATTLAKRIQSLIDTLPFPTPGKSDHIPVQKNPKPPAQDSNGRPIFPPNTTPVKDSGLISFLSSPTIMNGSTVKGRPSIWSVLESLGVPSHGFPPAGEETAEGGNNDTNEGTTDDTSQPVFSDDTSVMVYSPLIPGAGDLVELAEQVPMVSDQFAPSEFAPWTSVWPLSIWYTPSSQSDPTTPAESNPALLGELTTSPPRTSADSAGRIVRVQTAKAWVPSTTKLSVQAFWWGYRLYLPPPIMDILSDQTLEAAKRAAMITTALTWIFNNLPVTALPPPLQPAALLLQRIAPYLGYIGTFISWTWGTIKGYDKGYGVILTATWLLPIALIPGTWKENDYPKSPSQVKKVPLPPQTPSSPLMSLPTSPYVPSTTPTSPSVLSATPGPSSPATNTVTIRTTIEIPVAPTPPLEDLPPIPPVPGTPGVPVGSPLSDRLLQGPLLPTVPLPEEDAEGPQVKPKKEKKSRAKALFSRSTKQ